MNKEINFDFDRQNRIGIIEAIWGEHKNVDQLKKQVRADLLKAKKVK